MSNEHAGHRERMRKKLQNSDISQFAPHEILEIMLYYCIPRKNTNDIAHNLLTRFGSLSNVCLARSEQLCEIDGISESSATFLNLIPKLMSAFERDCKHLVNVYENIEDFEHYIWSLFIGKRNECMYTISLDSKGKLICSDMICEGDEIHTNASPRKIVDTVLKSKATQVVIAHNHPSDISRASDEDIETTAAIKALFGTLGIRLIDHYIVTRTGAYSMTKSGYIR